MCDQEKPKSSTKSISKLTPEYAQPFSKDVLASQASYRTQTNLFWVATYSKYFYKTH